MSREGTGLSEARQARLRRTRIPGPVSREGTGLKEDSYKDFAVPASSLNSCAIVGL